MVSADPRTTRRTAPRAGRSAGASTHAMAPKVRRAVRGETREQRAAARATIGNLRNLLVSPQINQRYQVAAAYFLLLG